MNLEQAIHLRWQYMTDLNDALSVDRVTTGCFLQGERPYVNLERQASQHSQATNIGDVLQQVPYIFHLWPTTYDEGRQLAEKIVSAFDGVSFSESGLDEIARLCRRGEAMTQDDTGLWHFELRFQAVTYRTPW